MSKAPFVRLPLLLCVAHAVMAMGCEFFQSTRLYNLDPCHPNV